MLTEHWPGHIVSISACVHDESRAFIFFHLVRHGDRSSSEMFRCLVGAFKSMSHMPTFAMGDSNVVTQVRDAIDCHEGGSRRANFCAKMQNQTQNLAKHFWKLTQRCASTRKTMYLPVRERGKIIATNAKSMTHGQLDHRACQLHDDTASQLSNLRQHPCAPCRIRVACGLRRSMRRILRRILWRIFWRISLRILRRIFLAYPHS